MKPAKSHPFLAAFLDYYFVSLSLLSVIVVIQASLGRVFLNQIAYIVIFILLLVTDILYHAWLNRKVSFLSYGEIVSGKCLENKRKVWKNPYHKNRFFLFMVIVASFLLIGNTWNEVVFLVLKPAFILGSIFKLAFVFWGAYLVGQGKIRGVFLSMTPFLVGAFFLFSIYRVYGTYTYLIMLITFLTIIVGLLISYFFYRKQKI